MDIKNTCITALVVLLSVIPAMRLVAGTPEKQAEAPVAPKAPQTAQPTTSKRQSHASSSIKYVNHKYRFTFSLPKTWKGYSTVEDTWTGDNDSGTSGSKIWEHGPQIRIVNPKTTTTKEYQDIYVMVFTHAQWDSIQQGNLTVSAASVGPGELGRNRKYVFAEPPRMIDSDNLCGWEEVVKIIQSDPLHAF